MLVSLRGYDWLALHQTPTLPTFATWPRNTNQTGINVFFYKINITCDFLHRVMTPLQRLSLKIASKRENNEFFRIIQARATRTGGLVSFPILSKSNEALISVKA